MSQASLFQDEKRQSISVTGGELLLVSQAFSAKRSETYFSQLRESIRWSQDEISIAGKQVKIPRLQAWYGDSAYSYSGLRMTPFEWTPLLLEIKRVVEDLAGSKFNSVLLNLYRDGEDSVGWHSDDEPELGVNPVIASLSLGESRYFSLQHKKLKNEKLKLQLTAGDLLIMSGALQHNWRHQVPKTRSAVGERINLTFRLIM